MNESCHTYEWDMSHMDESCHTYEWDMSHMDESCLTSATRVRCMQVSHMNESCDSFIWIHVFAHMNESWDSCSNWCRQHVSVGCRYLVGLTHCCEETWLSHMWHDSFQSDAGFSYVWRTAVKRHESAICDMTHSYVWHDSFMYVTWLIPIGCWYHVCMTHCCEETWLILMLHDSFICVTWLILIVCRFLICMTHCCEKTWLIHIWHDSFICVTWLIPIVCRYPIWTTHCCDMTHSYVCRDLLIYGTALIYREQHSFICMRAVPLIHMEVPFHSFIWNGTHMYECRSIYERCLCFFHVWQVYVCRCRRTCWRYMVAKTHMGWLRLVGSIKLQVSCTEYSLFYRALLQKRPIILSILLTEVAP